MTTTPIESPSQPRPDIQSLAVDWRNEWKPLAAIVGVFVVLFFLPAHSARFDGALLEAVQLAGWYAREHVLLCLVPAFFIAGAISVFLSSGAVMKYLGPRAPRPVAYGVASVSGTILAVCSCSVLPLFGGIYRMGAGLGPATAFLYSGPAINVLAIALTARVLGWELGVARAVGAIALASLIGLAMHAIHRRDEAERTNAWGFGEYAGEEPPRTLRQNIIFFGALVAILVFANWGRPADGSTIWATIWEIRWWLTAFAATGLGAILVFWFRISAWKMVAVAAPVVILAVSFPSLPTVAFAAGSVAFSIVLAREPGELGEWFASSWGFAKQITPLLFAGVMIAGFLLGRPGREGIIPSAWVASAFGGDSVVSVFVASLAGALMYLATLTEVPILQGLIGAGMGPGPALALLLAGPSLSLPSILVIARLVGWRKTITYVILVVISATVAGLLYGTLV